MRPACRQTCRSVFVLLLQVSNRDAISGDARINQHVEMFGEGFVADFQPRLVLSGRNDHPVLVSQIPNDAIEPRILRDARWWRAASARRRRVRIVGRLLFDVDIVWADSLCIRMRASHAIYRKTRA